MSRIAGFTPILAGLILLCGQHCAPAQQSAATIDQSTEDSERSVRLMRHRALAYLRLQRPPKDNGRGPTIAQIGESALIALAMMKAGIRPENEDVAVHIHRIAARAENGIYRPDRTGGADNYEAALVCMALAEADRGVYRSQIAAAAQYLQSKQKPDGAWDYKNGRTGDTSMTQMAVLGLWAAAQAGIEVPSSVWTRVSDWLVGTQYANGGFAYHPGQDKTVTHSMTAGALGALYICRAQLDPPKPGSDDGRAQSTRFAPTIARGRQWMTKNITMSGPSGHYYYFFYSVERLGALGKIEKFDDVDWYATGIELLKQQQRPDGGWARVQGYSTAVQTSFALLFLVKATHQSFQPRLGAGTLLAGRGLPDDLSLLTMKQGRLVVPAIKVTIDQLLRQLREGKLRGPVEITTTDGSSEETLEGLARLARDPEPEVREKAVWGLGRLENYDAVPALIERLRDPDGGVVLAARNSLRRISRKPEGFGLARVPTKQQVEEAVNGWRTWYQTVQAYDELAEPRL